MINPVLIEDCDVGEVSSHYPGLHHKGCKGSAEDIKKMQDVLASDPNALDRLQWKCDQEFTFSSITPPELYHGFEYPLFPIHDATRMGHFECVKFMIEAGANINKNCPNCKHGINLLRIAMTSLRDTKSYDILKYLIKNGVNPNKMYKNKIIADLVYGPAKNGDIELLKFFLENECVPEDLEVTKDFKLRPLLVPTNDHVQQIKAITGELLTPCLRISALSSGLGEGHVEVYKLLLFYGASNVVYFPSDPVTSTNYTFYSIPHFILQCFCESIPDITTHDVLYALKVYQMFGGNMWSTQNPDANFWVTDDDPPPKVRCTETALTYLRRKPALKTLFPGLEEELEKMMMEEPLSLKALSRVAVRKAMGRRMWCNINKLAGVPQELQSYLHFPVNMGEIV